MPILKCLIQWTNFFETKIVWHNCQKLLMVIIGELNGKVVMTKKKTNLVYNIFSMNIVYYWISKLWNYFILCPQDVTQRALSFLIDSIASALLYVYHDMAQLIFSKIRIWMVVSDNAFRLSIPDILQVKIW